jgi:hypothetical protein
MNKQDEMPRTENAREVCDNCRVDFVSVKFGERLERELNEANARVKVLERALEMIVETSPQHGMNPSAKVSGPAHMKTGWNVHFIARAAIAKGQA